MAYIQELTDESGESVYPVTKTNAVYDTNGHRLSDSMLTVGDPVEKLEDIKINADTLGGKEASIYIPFPDYTKVIAQGNINTSNNSMSSVAYTEYTAIEDCILCIHFTLISTSKHGHVALVNNNIVYGRESDVATAANCETECVLWLKKGDVAKMKALSNSNNSFYRVHGLR